MTCPCACRDNCLRGQDAAFGANSIPRFNASTLAGFEGLGGYYDTGKSLMIGPSILNPNGTIDEWLLDHWYQGASSYDGLFVHSLSSPGQVRLKARLMWLPYLMEKTC